MGSEPQPVALWQADQHGPTSFLCAYLSSGPIVVMVIEKVNAVFGNRELMGATNPNDAEEGTIRKKYGISIDKNSVHGSDSVENAKIEIDFFFKD